MIPVYRLLLSLFFLSGFSLPFHGGGGLKPRSRQQFIIFDSIFNGGRALFLCGYILLSLFFFFAASLFFLSGFFMTTTSILRIKDRIIVIKGRFGVAKNGVVVIKYCSSSPFAQSAPHFLFIAGTVAAACSRCSRKESNAFFNGMSLPSLLLPHLAPTCIFSYCIHGPTVYLACLAN